MSPVLPAVRINGVTVIRCEPGWSWNPRAETLPDFDLWFAWIGRGTLVYGTETVPITAGSAFCLRPRHEYSMTHDPSHRLGVCAIHFDFISPDGAVVRPHPETLPPQIEHLPNVERYEQILRQVAELFLADKAGTRDRAAAYLDLVLHDLCDTNAPTSSPGPSERIREVMRHVRENPGRIFTVAELASRAAYSPDHFSRLFTNATGMGLKEFCIRTRLERAQQLLDNSSMTIEQIALALGYADVFFFSRQFKRQIGVPPQRWRKGRQEVSAVRSNFEHSPSKRRASIRLMHKS